MSPCARCGGEPVVASCCSHLARGLATFAAEQHGAQRVCTHCQPSDAALPLCAACAETMRARNVPVAEQRTYALVERAAYDDVLGLDRPRLCAITVGDHVKVGLSKIPLVEPRWLESIWVRVTTRAGERLRGAIENDLDLFTPGQLEQGMELELTVDNVVDVLPGGELTQRPHECLQCLGAGRELDAGDKKLLSDVRTVGFHVLKVFADEDGPAFAFTVGLHHRFGHPELIVVGLDVDTAHSALNRLGKTIADGNYPDLGGVLEATQCELREPALPGVRESYLGYARWFYRSDDFPVRQLYWPGCEVRL